MEKMILVLLCPLMLFADQLILNKTTGTPQRTDLATAKIVFFGDNLILNGTTMPFTTVRSIAFATGSVFVISRAVEKAPQIAKVNKVSINIGSSAGSGLLMLDIKGRMTKQVSKGIYINSREY